MLNTLKDLKVALDSGLMTELQYNAAVARAVDNSQKTNNSDHADHEAC
jgi:hypothetical protein